MQGLTKFNKLYIITYRPYKPNMVTFFPATEMLTEWPVVNAALEGFIYSFQHNNVMTIKTAVVSAVANIPNTHLIIMFNVASSGFNKQYHPECVFDHLYGTLKKLLYLQCILVF